MYVVSATSQTVTTTRAIPESTPWLGALIARCRSNTWLSSVTVTVFVGDEVVSHANVKEPVSPGCCTRVKVTIELSLMEMLPIHVPT